VSGLPPDRGGPRLLLRDLVKHYRSGGEVVRAVDGVCLQVAPGELVAICGPSGSGKSTLLMLIAALLAPDEGEIVFDGRQIGSLTPRESAAYRSGDVGLISQQPHLIPAASALDNAMIKLPVLGFGVRQARAKALPWLQRLGIGEQASRPAERLSLGERQRVTIARALAPGPRLLLADEPTGSLDSVRSREVFALLRDLCHEREMPGLLVTHDEQATNFVDRVLSMRDGRIVEVSDAERERDGEQKRDAEHERVGCQNA
jgi:putative ABC transport system ATP-binding protein